ncbi:hypothetical protein [Paracoccus salsus]|uniref:hypothetical protein n=1 Tax=Paracoccus salsus TaxID=2911061 RepID=UPI001F2D1772|nr:hypothetical protein [Paracoccus salsus]MCF3973189.1 hypothetical protein [Paracoccus salsus]
MRGDLMTWVQRLVGAVFLIGLVALGAAVFALVRQAEGTPPLPIYVGLLGAVLLILLAGACMAVISISISVRHGAEMLRRIAAQGGGATASPSPGPTPRPLSATPSREETGSPEGVAPARMGARKLVAER